MIKNKQIDIFGNEISIVDITITENKYLGRKSIKQKFRENYGYKKDFYCKDCDYFKEYHTNDRKYFKCQKIGITSSSATDIRKKDIACNLYKKRPGISDKEFDMCYPIGYIYQSFEKQPPKYGEWEYIGLMSLCLYTYKRIR